jgi:hypothetical protein
MHSRLFGLFVVVGLYAAATGAAILLFGVDCFAVLATLGLPIVLVVLADHLSTERRIREERLDRASGFEIRPIDPGRRAAGPRGPTDEGGVP